MSPQTESVDSYHCWAVAERSTGNPQCVVLGEVISISPKLAVRWLLGQVRRIEDGLAPAPAASSARHAAVDDPVPAGLHPWANDPDEQHAARAELAETGRLQVILRDSSGRYALTVSRVPAPAPHHKNPEPRTHEDS